MSNLTAIADTITRAEYMSIYGEECADRYLNKAAEYGVGYSTAHSLMLAARECHSFDEFEAVVRARLAS